MLCIYSGHVYIFTPNMKFLCLTMWQGGLYTDNNDTDNDNDDDKARLYKALFLKTK